MPYTPPENPFYTHTLSKPFPYMGEELLEISLREPTSGDLMRIGHPVKYDLRFSPPDLSFDDEKSFKMIAALAGMSVAPLEKLSPGDAISLQWAMAKFFIPQ